MSYINQIFIIASEATERAKPATSLASFSKLHTVRKKILWTGPARPGPARPWRSLTTYFSETKIGGGLKN